MADEQLQQMPPSMEGASATSPAPSSTPPTVKPDGGVLGQAAMGALAGAASEHNAIPVPATPSPMEGAVSNIPAPPAMEGKVQDAVHPGLIDRATKFADDIITDMPGIGDAKILAGAIHDWADKKMQAPPTLDENPLTAAAKTFGLGVARDTASLVQGAASAKGLATIGAAIVAPVPTGIYLAGSGLHDFVQGWGDIHNLDDLMNPDFAQSKLNQLAQVAGGAAGVAEGWNGVSKAWENNKAGIKDGRLEAFKKAFPPSKMAPYSDADWAAAEKRIMDEHLYGNPVSDSKSAVDAMNSAVTKIENQIADAIKTAPDTVINPDIFQQIRARLQASEKVGFYEEGLKSLENYKGIGFERQPAGVRGGAGGEVDAPMTLERADALRHTMNADNTAFVGTLNKYDYANLMETNPAFAARNIAAEAIRNAEYEALGKLGLKNAADLRGVEGSILKLRNAAQRQFFKDAEATVPGARPKAGPVRKAVGKAVKVGTEAAMTAGGAALGGALGPVGIVPGAVAGGIAGGELGGALERAIAGQPVTRGELINQAFTPSKPPGAIATTRAKIQGATRQAAIGGGGEAGAVTGAVTRQLPEGHVHVRASDGSEHYIPHEQLGSAVKIDPGLEILRSK